jgi:hypothetical protein
MLVFQLDPKHCIGQRLSDHCFDLYRVFFRQDSTPFRRRS